jgi:phosphatidylinositol alpha-1,6-mannosyltransferase
MRLLVITELYLPTRGGTAVWFDEVYRRLGGQEIHIVTADVPGATEHDLHHPNSVHRVRLRRHWWLKPESLGMYAKLLWRATNIALTNKVDAVHTGRVLPEGLIGWIVARLVRVPLVVYAHGEEITTWRQPGKFRVMRFVYHRADIVVANSEFTRDELLKLDVAENRIRLIYPGVDVERFRPGLPCDDLKKVVALKSNEKLILSVGRLSRRKGFDMVIRSLPEFISHGILVRYAIIGIGEDQAYLTNLSRNLGVEGCVHLLGHVSPEDLPRWYNACDVFAMPNREINGDTEGFGMVFIEAAACGKPSLAGVAGGTGSAVIEGVTGQRIDGNNIDEVVNGLGKLLVERDLAEALGAQGHKRVLREHSWQRVAEKTMALT